MTIQELYKIIQERKSNSSDNSYTASLLNSGVDRVAQKVGEEAVEVVIASKNDNKDEFVGEVADLYYHLLVLLTAKNIGLEEVEKVLDTRHSEKTSAQKEVA